MTKRTGVFGEINSKKLKVDDNLEELWNEDPGIDDCLILATQACEQKVLNCTQLNSTSILPNYNFFQQDANNLFTSTQSNKAIIDGASNLVKRYNNYESKNVFTNHDNKSELQTKIQELKEKYESKEGEVSMLRSQLKETKSHLEVEYQKKEKEWVEKVNFTNKELNSIKSKLEFKDLEMVNLKNKISGMSKAYSTDNFFNNTLITSVEKPQTVNRHFLGNYKIEPYVETKCPLAETISPLIFNIEHFEHSRKGFTRNQINNKKNNDRSLLESHHSLASILSDISALMTSDLQSINLKNNWHHIDQIVYVSYNTLFSFHSYLSNYLECDGHNRYTQQENILFANGCSDTDQELEKNLFDPRPWCDRENGIRARQTVAVLGAILPYSIHLQSTFQNYIDNQGNIEENFRNYLNLILTTVTIIRVTRKTDICEGFLSAVAMLVYQMSQTKIFDKCYSFTLRIGKEIIFTRPPARVLKKLILFFKQASLQPNFVEELCKKSGTSSKLENKKESYTQDSCFLQLFVTSYKQNFINRNTVDIENNLNTLQFIMNLMNCNPAWLHYRENNHCKCLSEITRLGIHVIHEFVRNYKKQKKYNFCKNDFCQYNEFLKYSIKFLNIATSKYFDVINKYSVDSEYKFIVKSLLDIQEEIGMSEFECETLKELNLQEDLLVVNGVSFNAIPMWK